MDDCRYALDIAQAICYLHDARIVHLDLKPANVIVTLSDVCKLGDFGCCQVSEALITVCHCMPDCRKKFSKMSYSVS